MGYTLYLDNLSEGREKIINTVKGINIYQIPYRFLKKIRIERIDSPISQKQSSKIISLKQVVHPNPGLYYLQTNPVKNDDMLYLSQSYDSGWKAYADGKEIKKHVLVNNWANGWIISQSQLNQLNQSSQSESVESGESKKVNIVIIFWPQYLEFAGFGLLILGFVIVLKFPQKASESAS